MPLWESFGVAHANRMMLDFWAERVELLLVPFFVPFFFVGGWCRIELCHFCKLWQENEELLTSSGFCNPTLVLGLRVLQPNTSCGA